MDAELWCHFAGPTTSLLLYIDIPVWVRCHLGREKFLEINLVWWEMPRFLNSAMPPFCPTFKRSTNWRQECVCMFSNTNSYFCFCTFDSGFCFAPSQRWFKFSQFDCERRFSSPRSLCSNVLCRYPQISAWITFPEPRHCPRHLTHRILFVFSFNSQGLTISMVSQASLSSPAPCYQTFHRTLSSPSHASVTKIIVMPSTRVWDLFSNSSTQAYITPPPSHFFSTFFLFFSF